jgi:hypothetical protein
MDGGVEGAGATGGEVSAVGVSVAVGAAPGVDGSVITTVTGDVGEPDDPDDSGVDGAGVAPQLGLLVDGAPVAGTVEPPEFGASHERRG